jgi:predicted acetylornithine/succinylornithine family transaminase
MNKEEIIQGEGQYLVHTYNRPPVVFERGEGVYLYDTEGNEYLDFMAGIAVNALGHADAEWVQAVAAQAGQLTHVSNLYHTGAHVQLARRLVENSFADRVFFCNSGSEANETAVKFARKWAGKRGEGRGGSLQSPVSSLQSPKTRLVSFSHAFHGRTLGSLSITHKQKYREPFEPLLPGVMFAGFNDLTSAQAAISDDVCAVIVEPVQGEGGVHPATPEFLQGLRQLCDEHQALLIFDEVQCGLGRTGHLWAYEAFGVAPDIMTLAKPLAGGLPIGAVLVTEAVASAIEPGDHGSTFAGGPLVCSAAQVVFDRVNQPEFLATVRENGAYLQHRLKTMESEQIVAVRGLGLMVGLELNTAVAPLIAAARDRGLILVGAGDNVIRFVPPLIITREQIDEAVAVVQSCLED